MIDNIEIIKQLLDFNSEDDFYHLQIIKRKKENPELGSNSYIVKTYYVTSIEYLDKKYDEIKTLCNLHNARASINLNKRSFERMAFHLMKKVCDQIMNKDFKSVRKAYESVCGSYSNETNKKWILDMDTKEDFELRISTILNPIEPVGNKVLCKIPTKNGYHLITSPFNVEKFKKLFPDVDIHKDNPTLLYMSIQ